MNAQTAITRRKGPRAQDYRRQVELRRPGCSAEELPLLCSIALMGDRASTRLIWCTRESGVLWEHIEHLAEVCLSEAMSLDQLREVRGLMLRLGTAASDLARIFAPAPVEEGALEGG